MLYPKFKSVSRVIELPISSWAQSGGQIDDTLFWLKRGDVALHGLAL
jgi:hypothetical protein